MMDYQHFIVVGDTVNEEKYAYKGTTIEFLRINFCNSLLKF